MQTAESNFSNFVIKYLGEIKTEFENILACLSGAQMGLNQEKNWRSKILRHTPVNSSCGLRIPCYFIPSNPIPTVRYQTPHSILLYFF